MMCYINKERVFSIGDRAVVDISFDSVNTVMMLFGLWDG